jgi:hypothetical protein
MKKCLYVKEKKYIFFKRLFTMKKHISTFLLASILLIINSSLYAVDQKQEKTITKKTALHENDYKFMISYKPSFFYPTHKVFRNIYDCGFLSIFGLDFSVYKNLNIFTDIGYLSEKGKVSSVNASTKVYLVPWTLGLKYIYNYSDFFSFYDK